MLSQLDSYQNAQRTNLIDQVNGVVGQYLTEPDLHALTGDSYIGMLNSQPYGGWMQNLLRLTLNRMVFNAQPRLGQTLQQVNILDSIYEVVRQMKYQGVRVRVQAIGATPSSSFTNELGSITPGNGVIVAGTRRPNDGLLLQHALAETLELVCAADGQLDGRTEGNEIFSLTGTGGADVFAFDWPLGSDASTSLTVIDGNSDNTNGNVLTNSRFTAFTVVNKPDNWELVTGTAGNHFFKETSIVYDGAAALRITGDGSTLVQMRQRFDNAAGTLGELEPLTEYKFNVWIRRDGTAAAAGQWIWDLVDVNGVAINDADGNANSLTVDLTTLSTLYAPFNFSLRTPASLPSAYYLRGRMPTGNALSDGRSVYIDKGGLGLGAQSVRNGVYVAIFAGSVPFRRGDRGTIAVTNGRGAAGTLDTMQTVLYRLLPEAAQNEIIFPYAPTAGTEEVVDATLIA